jgi:hypothetical protein
VKQLPDVLGARPVDAAVGEDTAALTGAPPPRPHTGVTARASVRLRALALELRWPLAVYGASRVLIMLTAVIETFFRKWSLWGMLSNWDGQWYLQVLVPGYPSHVSHVQTPLGFFPLYPALMWLPTHLVMLHPTWERYELSGLLVSLITGASATVLVGRLAAGWWGEQAGRRTVLFFCFFPGAVVFSMVYTEGLLLTLVAGCLLAMQQRRWLIAGVLAAFSTAVGPIAIALIPACAAAAVIELSRHGWRDPKARRALITPLMAPLGLLSFGAYLWIHTGTPLASYEAQRYGWQESSSPLALVHTGQLLYKEIFPPAHVYAVVNSNYVAGLVGAAILFAGLVLIMRRPRVPLPALVWTLGVAALTFTSAQTPPNARMLLCAFPATIVFAQRLRGRRFTMLMTLNVLLLAGMSWVTFVGVDLRP